MDIYIKQCVCNVCSGEIILLQYCCCDFITQSQSVMTMYCKVLVDVVLHLLYFFIVGHSEVIYTVYVTLDHKTSHKGKFSEIRFPLMYCLLGSDNIWPRYNYLKIWNLRVQKNLNIEKITFKLSK